jgi:Raf kinase inhibitor-like YbhB/YbcL family protein
MMFNIPPTRKELPENVPATAAWNDGIVQGTNDFRKIGYGGPCPPSGTHRYFFKLYALDTILKIEAPLTKAQLLKAMEKHILSQGQLMGTFKR